MSSRALLGLPLALLAFGCRDEAPATAANGREWRDEVIYQLVTDRFANGDRTNDGDADPTSPASVHGGDWRGIEERLDYIQALGATAIWISPVVENIDSPLGRQAYHGYWPLALDRPNPRFGTLGDLQALVAACHGRGLKILADVVVNHLGPVAFYDLNDNDRLDVVGGSGSPENELSPPYRAGGVLDRTGSRPSPFVFFEERAQRGALVSPAALRVASAFHRRGTILGEEDDETLLGGDFRGGVRDLDTSNARVASAIEEATMFWLDVAPFDGFRYDAARHVEDVFWIHLLPRVRERVGPPLRGDDGFLQVAEVFDGRPEVLARFTDQDLFDSVFDFGTHGEAFDATFRDGGPVSAAREVHRAQEAVFQPVPQPGGIRASPRQALLRFIDNHDLPRFLSVNPDRRALRAALAYLLLMDGVPVIYYGTEQELAGGADPANREDLWLSGYSEIGDTFQWIRLLTRIRRGSLALRRGDLRFISVGSENDTGLLAFERRFANERVLVVINARPDSASTTSSIGRGLRVDFPPSTPLVDWVDPRAAPVVVATDGSLGVTIPAYGARVLSDRAQ